jgi:hypothetical protein
LSERSALIDCRCSIPDNTEGDLTTAQNFIKTLTIEKQAAESQQSEKKEGWLTSVPLALFGAGLFMFPSGILAY